MRGSPEVFAVNHLHWRCSRVKVVKQPRVDTYAPGLAVPASVGLEIGAVTEGAATAVWAEVMRHHFCLPAVSRHVSLWRGQTKLRGFVIGVQRAALGTE